MPAGITKSCVLVAFFVRQPPTRVNSFAMPSFCQANSSQLPLCLGLALWLWPLGAPGPILAAPPQWIWNDPAAATKAARGRAYFRIAFDAPEVQSARIEIACDNVYALFVNNEKTGAGIDWQQYDAYDITPLLRKGRNSLAVLTGNGEPGPAGLVVRLTYRDKAGQLHEVSSGKEWRTNLNETPGWREPNFDDTSWPHAAELGALGMAPWGELKVVEHGAVRQEFVRKPRPTGPFQLLDGDRVVFLGDTLVERASRDDFWEAALTARFPERHITFRNLGWSADTPGGDARAGFGTVEDGYQQLKVHVAEARPTVIFIGYGSALSFDGERGLDRFEAGLQRLIDDLAITKAELVLVSPLRHEHLPKPLPDPAAHNRDLERYTRRIEQVAKQRQLPFVDLFDGVIGTSMVQPGQSLTDNGLHLRARGYLKLSKVFQDRLGWTGARPQVELTAAGKVLRQAGLRIENLRGIATGGLEFDLRLDRLPLPEVGAPSGLRLRVEGLPTGTWKLVADGTTCAAAPAETWREGVDVTKTPDAVQFEQLRKAIVEKNQLYFHRWRPQNETYLFGFRKHEQGNNAREVPMFEPLVETQEAAIAKLRVPQTVHYRLVRE
jgi:lysophospholipase L1-like esterase